MSAGSTVTGNSSLAIERHIGSSYKTILYVSKYLNEIKIIADNFESGAVSELVENMGDILVVSTNITGVNTVASIKDDVVVVSSIAGDVTTVSSNIADVIRVKESIIEVIQVAQSSDNIDRVALSINNLDRVFASIDNIDIVANDINNVILVGGSIAYVNALAANLTAIVTVSDNMADVVNAASFVDAIHEAVAAAELAEANAAQSATNSEQSNVESAANANATANDVLAIAAIRDEVEADRTEVTTKTNQVITLADEVVAKANQVSTDTQTVADNLVETNAAKELAKLWAVGSVGSGSNVPSSTNNAYYFSEVARNNANQTFKSGGYFTPTAGQEYPNVVGITTDTIWLIKFAASGVSYTYTSGDMAGKTVENGFMLVYDTPSNMFDYIPTTITGVYSVNGVLPDATNAVTIDADDVGALPVDAKAADSAKLNGRSDHYHPDNNPTAPAVKAVEYNALTGAAYMPAGTTAQRPNTSTLPANTKALRFNTTLNEWEGEDAEGNYASIGGGGVPVMLPKAGTVTVVRNKAIDVDLASVDGVVIVPQGLVNSSWFGVKTKNFSVRPNAVITVNFTNEFAVDNKGIEYGSFLIDRPCTVYFQKIEGKWAVVDATGEQGNLNGLTNRVEALEEWPKSGSNTNGRWVKYKDGTMECHHRAELGVLTYANQIGSLYKAPNLSWDFPESFISEPVVDARANNASHAWLFGSCSNPSTTSCTYSMFASANLSNITTIVGLSAFGRWK